MGNYINSLGLNFNPHVTHIDEYTHKSQKIDHRDVYQEFCRTPRREKKEIVVNNKKLEEKQLEFSKYINFVDVLSKKINN